jgi:SpoVK/Ycf46/Vps4 family AAA+-type ATPase
MTPATEFVREFQRVVRAGFTLVSVVTSEEPRARELLALACANLQVEYWTPATGRRLREAIENAKDKRTVHIAVDAGAELADPATARIVREIGLGARHGLVVFLGSSLDVSADVAREIAEIELALPSRDEIAAVLETAAGETAASWDRSAFVRAAAGLGLVEAARAFRLAKSEPDATSALRAVIAQKKRELRRSAALELVDVDIALGDVGGLDVLKAWLASRVRAYGDDARTYGLPEPRGMLLCGVQGCGKSHASKAAATVLGLPLVRLDFAAVFATASPERALREGLRAVNAMAPLVLWVDEIEKGLGGAADGAQVRVFGAFLTWLQERTAPVFVAATANEVEHLPPELARRGRFDEVFFVDLPSAVEREEILSVSLRRRGREPGGHGLAQIARPLDHFSGAELEQVVASALFRAFAQKREVGDEDLRAAAREIVPLATLYEEKIQALRNWGKTRARKASADRRMLELFDE